MWKPSPGPPSERVRAHLHVVELQVHASESADAERIGDAMRVMPGRVHRHQEGADAAAAAAGLRRGEDDRQIGGLRIRHPDLASVDHVPALVEPRHRLLVGRVRAGMLLRQREGAERLARSPAAAARSPSAPRMPKGASGSATSELLTRDHRDDGAAARERFEREGVADVVAPAPPHSVES